MKLKSHHTANSSWEFFNSNSNYPPFSISNVFDTLLLNTLDIILTDSIFPINVARLLVLITILGSDIIFLLFV